MLKGAELSGHKPDVSQAHLIIRTRRRFVGNWRGVLSQRPERPPQTACGGMACRHAEGLLPPGAERKLLPAVERDRGERRSHDVHTLDFGTDLVTAAEARKALPQLSGAAGGAAPGMPDRSDLLAVFLRFG